MRSFWLQSLTFALIALLAASVSFALWRTADVQRHQNDALRTIMCRAEAFVKHSSQATPQQKRQALNFYDDALGSIHAKPCSR